MATRLTLDYAFHVIGLDMVWLKVSGPETAGRNTYVKAGFREVGTMRGAGVRKGHRCGEMVMDSLPKGFPWPCRECSGAAFSVEGARGPVWAEGCARKMRAPDVDNVGVRGYPTRRGR